EIQPTWEESFKVKGWKERILQDFGELKDGHYELLLPRSLIYRLLEVRRGWEKVEEKIHSFVYLIYIVGKIRESLRKRDLADKWWEFAKSNLLEKGNIPLLAHFAHWIDLLMREKGGAS
ncbi:MAG: hypothetical protein ACPL7E_00885, partial [bacterium]